jgi:hypothetical protein
MGKPPTKFLLVVLEERRLNPCFAVMNLKESISHQFTQKYRREINKRNNK